VPFAPGASLTGQVALQDGRNLPVSFKAEPPRPSVALISRVDVPAPREGSVPFSIKLSSENDLFVSDSLVFSVKADQPFPRNGSIELASQDGSMRAKLTLDAVSGESKPPLVLQDPKTLVATVQPLKLFGPSAFGPIRFRAVAPDGTTGDWIPLVTLVRLPAITGLTCRKAEPKSEAASAVADSAATAPPPSSGPGAAPSCALTGSNLYLIDSISAVESDPQPVKVPEGFVGTSINVPPPTGAVYYVRLRDDPAVLNTLSVPAGPIQAAAER